LPFKIASSANSISGAMIVPVARSAADLRLFSRIRQFVLTFCSHDAAILIIGALDINLGLMPGLNTIEPAIGGMEWNFGC
jgi:hypothetical protein